MAEGSGFSAPTVVEAAHTRPGPFAVALRALLRRKLGMLAIAYITLFYLCGIFSPLVAPYSPREQDLGKALQSPSLSHPFGTDRLGRDLLSRVVYAARTTVIITLLGAITGGLIIRPLLGLLAGYLRGWV